MIIIHRNQKKKQKLKMQEIKGKVILEDLENIFLKKIMIRR